MQFKMRFCTKYNWCNEIFLKRKCGLVEKIDYTCFILNFCLTFNPRKVDCNKTVALTTCGSVQSMSLVDRVEMSFGNCSLVNWQPVWIEYDMLPFSDMYSDMRVIPKRMNDTNV